MAINNPTQTEAAPARVQVVSVVEAKRRFSDFMARVAYSGERLVIERHGKPMMALVSMDDLRRLEAIAPDDELLRQQRFAALNLARAVRRRIRQEQSGVPLPDSAEELHLLRERDFREPTDLR